MKNEEKPKINYKENFREYFSYIKKYKLWLFLILLTVLVTSAKQIIEKFLLKVIIDKGTELSAGNIVLDVFMKIILVVALVYILVSLFSVASSWLKTHSIIKLESSAIYDLKLKYFKHIIGLDHNFHTTHKTGSLISKLTRGGSAMERMTDSITYEFGPLAFELVIALIALLYLDMSSALLITVTMILFVAFSYFMQKKSEPSNVDLNKAEDFEKGSISDYLTNIESIRHYGKEDYISSKYKQLNKQTKERQITHWNFFRFTGSGQVLILALGTFFLLYFSIKNFMEGKVTLGTLTFIYTTYLGLISPMYGFVHGIRSVSRSMADFQELFEYGKFENEIKDSPRAGKLKISKGEIEFKDISFNYGKRKIFEDFNLHIKPNEKVALVGHSGSGKTTLVKLLYRLYDINSGDILIDKKSIKEFKQSSLRAELSNVPQECILFDDTIFNNIKFSNPEASKEDVLRAIKFAQLDKVIANFPLKENTIVGERGVKLSGGEKQRVSIARAILANKRILILDEATAALDSETEHEIQRDLEKLLAGRTSIIIAHRLSTIMNADKIVVLKNGKIIQMGTHSELISKEGEYKHLWNLQKGGYIK